MVTPRGVTRCASAAVTTEPTPRAPGKRWWRRRRTVVAIILGAVLAVTLGPWATVRVATAADVRARRTGRAPLVRAVRVQREAGGEPNRRHHGARLAPLLHRADGRPDPGRRRRQGRG